MGLIAPYWSGTQKVKFTTDSGNSFTVQSNPTTYSSVALSQAQIMIPAAMAPTMINGPVEFPPQAIPLQWDQMSKPDYDTLATYINLQMGTMIDMNDKGWYGMLQLQKFEYAAGLAQNVGKVTAQFLAVGPAPGIHSTINTLATPTGLTQTVGTGGSYASGQSTWWAMTFWSKWGETTRTTPIQFTATAAGQSNTITWTLPTSGQYRRARIYAASTAAGLAAGQSALIMADVWVAFPQSWVDTTGLTGLLNESNIPTVNRAYTGFYSGGSWVNGS